MIEDQTTNLLDLKTQYASETETSFIDSPTGLYNHGFFQLYLEREIKRSDRYGASFSLAFIDIDSFSDLNRRKSHLYGDRMLKTLASLIVENIRDH